MENKWPILSYEKGKSTYQTLQLWSQIVGKIQLAVLPWVNHSWHITLHITATGLTTQSMRFNDQYFQIDFDFIAHQLKITTSKGESRQFDLHGISVADFYRRIFELLNELQINILINPMPVELVDPISFETDTIHAAYDKEVVTAFHQALLNINGVFLKFRAEFKGKCSPIHFFWGGFDLALSLFSGREAPKHPGGVPGMPNWVAEDAYCKEVSSCGFWTGSEDLKEAVFYCYLYPEPQGYKTAEVRPKEAYYHPTLSEFVLPYSAVQQVDDSDDKLLEFLRSTYGIGADLANWDRAALEY